MLKVEALKSAYGSAQILNGIDLEVGEGEVVALLGRNGVGKTTLMKTIMNLVPATGGDVYMKDRAITGKPTYHIARSGIGYVPQGRGIFDKLTVEENLRMGLRANTAAVAAIPEFVFERFPILAERHRQLAGTMSGGQKQQLAISRAMCGDPRVLLLDEPSEGIQPNIVQDIGLFLRELVTTRKISILMVEQNLGLVKAAADRFVIMVKGEIVYGGHPAELENEELLQRYLSV
ncbi:ABC transporter ATP-binding protein [Rhizobium sp. CFBP 8752]|uniref:ABC transporter ATP-binding protein n=1 Tax=Rhizobium sp. CFBP 8752 TaxID=2775301 RepID=UPI00178470AB|nr:ABC transporter ATP-binding protein [Rhizobium sp. CFBP 8752]MBD8665680.1 ABC transporter ATP-binding protein [Rhizobium sp. CFBP 8752]